MNKNTSQTWSIATNSREVHELVLASDVYTSNVLAPAPNRSFESTEYLINKRCVYLLREENRSIATFALNWEASFLVEKVDFSISYKPIYMRRFAIHPDILKTNTLIGAQCLKKAIEISRELGADAIRCEANPNITAMLTLTKLMGFKEQKSLIKNDNKVYLQKKVLFLE